MSDKQVYYLCSGEGESGSWEKVEMTAIGIKRRLTKERCGGDRWARAFEDAYELADGGYAAVDVENGEVKMIPTDMA